MITRCNHSTNYWNFFVLGKKLNKVVGFALSYTLKAVFLPHEMVLSNLHSLEKAVVRPELGQVRNRVQAKDAAVAEFEVIS